MTENETIKFVDEMTPIEKLKVYMNYYVNMLYWKYTSEYLKEYEMDKWTGIDIFEQFCDKSNIQINNISCDDWKERGFTSKSWIVLRTGSIYHYVHNSIN